MGAEGSMGGVSGGFCSFCAFFVGGSVNLSKRVYLASVAAQSEVCVYNRFRA